MISYADAKKKALKDRSEYDHCLVRKDAYIFTSIEDEGKFGGTGPMVILKENGRALDFTGYIYDHLGEKEIDSFEFGSEAEKKYLKDE